MFVCCSRFVFLCKVRASGHQLADKWKRAESSFKTLTKRVAKSVTQDGPQKVDPAVKLISA